jgi:hypothetical protein
LEIDVLLRSNEAIARLNQMRSPILCSGDATVYLRKQNCRDRMLWLYQRLFPEQFWASQAAIETAIDSRDGHSEREIEFLILLDEHYFPITPWQIEVACEEIIDQIWIQDCGINWQSGIEFGEIKPEWALLIPLTTDGWRYGFYDELISTVYQSIDLEFDSIINCPVNVNQTALRRRFCKYAPPLKYLPLALSLLEKRTRNIWLDVAEEEEYYSVEFSLKMIETLRREWRKATQINELCFSLSEWLAEDLKRFNQILEIWNQPYPQQ